MTDIVNVYAIKNLASTSFKNLSVGQILCAMYDHWGDDRRMDAMCITISFWSFRACIHAAIFDIVLQSNEV